MFNILEMLKTAYINQITSSSRPWKEEAGYPLIT